MFGLISGLAGAAATGLNIWSNYDANRRNQQLQREQWYRDDTAYQRTVRDMEQAGLNPLQGVSPVSSQLSTQIQPTDFSGIAGAFDSAIQGIMNQKQLDLQNKMIGLKAIQLGISPDQLNKFTDDDLINAYRKLIISNAQDAQKNAGSESGKYTSSFGKITNDVLDLLRGKNKSFNDFGSQLGELKDSYSVHSSKNKPASTRNEENSYGKRVQEYYYNSAHKNKNSSSRSFGNWLRAKVFKK